MENLIVNRFKFKIYYPIIVQPDKIFENTSIPILYAFNQITKRE